MRRAAALLIVPAFLSVGCTRPDLDVTKIKVGMTKREVLERVGNPTKRTEVDLHTDLHEYEAYDRYGAIKINSRSLFVRFVDGKVEAVGTLEDLKAGRSVLRTEASKASPASAPLAAPSAPAFDLRTELEKLEKLKKDGLISEAEFQELRQKVLAKAKAQ
ncbi:MAG: outer membrane protein assembly factor BamE [Geothrix sp.]|uniref:SHOCT domain-containing protein n=1 Tax=Geothrix sp. TaxID=1962974 RepID=UPI0017EAECC8|nr:outer membrane protein assembly factor BamE [Geothrix sp.]NWJ41287.1 outer membrane protein assembly factor BamE [Geothrix sp.]WIL20723.1 MAG: outer membrane protein assembly factor BamE [Geothrix sp.]